MQVIWAKIKLDVSDDNFDIDVDDQKWFLRPYFPLIKGMFVFRSGHRFSFRALEVPEPRVRKRSFSLTKMTFSSLSVRKTDILRSG